MNITKTLCLCAALSGAAGVQAMENREFVTQQDNTRVNNYQALIRIAGSGTAD